MKKAHLNFLLFFLTIILIFSCSRKKDKFLNKKFHSTATKYNFLFNGNNLYNEGLLEIRNDIDENFWDLIPLEQFKHYDFDEKNRENYFTKAEEKATLAIQKHSMSIQGKEKNPLMDEAYFLLGKSRYFDNRFIPAMEAFNYILFKYPASNLINKVKIWKQKVNIRLNQNELAIDNLKTLLYDNTLTKEERSIANSFIAQAYINTNELDKAATFLKSSVDLGFFEKDNPRKIFLLAQLYQELSNIDSAYTLYSEIVNLKRKTSREFYIHSILNRAAISDSIEDSSEQLISLSNNIENKNFRGIINYNLAMLNLKQNDSISSIYFKNAIASKPRDKTLISKIYNQLAQLNFKNKNYLGAGLYYDSTLTNLNNRSKEFRTIKKKRDNLNDLIFYETIEIEIDSIINLVKMSDKKRVELFNEYINDLEKKQSKRLKDENSFENMNSTISPEENNSSLFYFYNPTAVAFGKNNFKNKWGTRPLADDWRWSISQNIKELNPDIIEKESFSSKKAYTSLESYLNSIPKDQKTIDSLISKLNDAYFRLGSIYKDKFNEYRISIEKFEKLLKNNPDKNLIIPTKYFLFENYKNIGNLEFSNKMKEDILKNYPNTKYAKKLLNTTIPENNQLDPEKIYELIYSNFEQNNFVYVIKESEKNIINFENEIIAPKLELLKAAAIARVYGFSDYKEALNEIILNYSGTLEAKQAEYTLKNILPKITSQEFENNRISDNYKIIFPIDYDSENFILSQIEILQQYLQESKYFDFEVTRDFYNDNFTFVVIHGLKSFEGSLGLIEKLKKNNLTTYETIISSNENYKKIQIHKNLSKFAE